MTPLKSSARVLVEGAKGLRYQKVNFITDLNAILINAHNERLYPAIISPSVYERVSLLHSSQEETIGLIVDKCFIPIMRFSEYQNAVKRRSIFSEHLNYYGWEKLRIRAKAMQDRYKMREAFKRLDMELLNKVEGKTGTEEDKES